MYKRARMGEIPQFTGVSAPFDEPDEADFIVDTQHKDVEECIKDVLDYLNVERRSTKKLYY